MKPYKLSLTTRALGLVAPKAALKRMVAEKAWHEFSYDAAQVTNLRKQAPQNINPNDYSKQRDRLQIMREAIDLVANFAPAKSLVKKYAMYVAPISYNAQTGDPGLDAEVDDFIHNEWSHSVDVTKRFNLYQMLYFGVMGQITAGDYGWAFVRPGSEDGMDPEDMVQLPLCAQTVEADRLGGLYQNVVAPDYVGGVIIGQYGEPVGYRVFKRSVTVGQYTDPIEVPPENYIHYLDPVRSDSYRGISAFETAITAMRDFYEMNDYLKAKAKIAAAMTVFTSSPGAQQGPGAMDAYASGFIGNQGGLAQDIKMGQINHLPDGSSIEFPETASPGSESQWLMHMQLKLTAMSLNLPYSFAIDAVELGGVSGRLESEQARAEFKRASHVLHPHAERLKNAGIVDAVTKGRWSARLLPQLIKGRWGHRPHPQPDLGKEAQANVSLYQNGLVSPLSYWQDQNQNPETVADEMCKWVAIKHASAAKYGIDPAEAFGQGPIAPGTQDKSGGDNGGSKPGDGPSGQPEAGPRQFSAEAPKRSQPNR